MLRRLALSQPDDFAFTDANRAWAEGQMTKFPEGRQASAIIPILWRAQEQEGWLSRAAIEHVAGMLGLAYIRALEVATFYFMFHLQPVGRSAHIQVCGTTSCMICGAEDLIAVCREAIAPKAHQVSADGNFSWEEVECLGACTNAPMAQIGKDYYEDLTAEGLRDLIGRFAKGEVPVPGPQNGRFSSEPASGLTTLEAFMGQERNASAQAAVDLRETVKRIDGTEVPLTTPWRPKPETPPENAREIGLANQPEPAAGSEVDETGVSVHEATHAKKGHPRSGEPAEAAETDPEPTASSADGTAVADDGRTVSHRGDDEETRSAAPKTDDGPDPKPSGTVDAPVMSGGRRSGAGGEMPREPSPQGAGRDVTAASKVVDTVPENTSESSPARPDSVQDPGPSPVAPSEESQPVGLPGPRAGGADDLTRIRGVGPSLAALVNGIGFYHLDQIAAWNPAEVAWVDANLTGFRGRVTRDDWVGQAKALVAGDAPGPSGVPSGGTA